MIVAKKCSVKKSGSLLTKWPGTSSDCLWSTSHRPGWSKSGPRWGGRLCYRGRRDHTRLDVRKLLELWVCRLVVNFSSIAIYRSPAFGLWGVVTFLTVAIEDWKSEPVSRTWEIGNSLPSLRQLKVSSKCMHLSLSFFISSFYSLYMCYQSAVTCLVLIIECT